MLARDDDQLEEQLVTGCESWRPACIARRGCHSIVCFLLALPFVYQSGLAKAGCVEGLVASCLIFPADSWVWWQDLGRGHALAQAHQDARVPWLCTCPSSYKLTPSGCRRAWERCRRCLQTSRIARHLLRRLGPRLLWLGLDSATIFFGST